MRSLLIAGGAGFIGSHYARYLLDHYEDYRVTVFDRLTYAGHRETLADLDSNPRFGFVQGDIARRSQVEAAVREREIDTIVNFAAETHVDRSILEPGSFIQTDVYGVHVLLELTRDLRLERLLHVSTDEVYGDVEDGRSLETDPLRPSSPYSASKAAGDFFCTSYFRTYGVPVVVTRGANSIGPYQYPEKVVPLFITSALNGLPLPLYGDGQQVRDYQYVLDHCEGIDTVLHHGTDGEVYNVGSGIETRNLDLATSILDLLGEPHDLIRQVEDRPGHDRRYALDTAKLEALGWTGRHAFDEALERTVRWYQKNEAWWGPLRQEKEYRTYYERQYAQRLRAGRSLTERPADARGP